MTGSALVLRADALRLPLADESVDLIVSSPPYFALRSYREVREPQAHPADSGRRYSCSCSVMGSKGHARASHSDSLGRSAGLSEGVLAHPPAVVPPTCPAVVLDIFGGTGTTAGVARALGRIGVSVDLSADYSRLADYMIHRSGRFSKVVQRTHKENQGVLI